MTESTPLDDLQQFVLESVKEGRRTQDEIVEEAERKSKPFSSSAVSWAIANLVSKGLLGYTQTWELTAK